MSLRNRVKSSARRRKNLRFQTETLEPRIVLDSTVVFNEIMFNPPGEDTGQEWIEFYNQLNVDMDISEWVVDGAVDYEFPDGTVVPARSHMVLAAEPEKLAESGISSTGPWEGNLNNSGETLRLYNNSGRLMNEVTYADSGDWPAAADGGGVSIAKGDQLSASHLAANWTFSQRVGGTPGVDNFVRPGTFRYEDVLAEEAPVRATVPSDASLGLDWTQPGFDDSGWLEGTTGVGHEGRSGYEQFIGLNPENPPNGQTPMPVEDVNATIYMRVPFEYDASSAYDQLTLGMRYDDGFIVYLNGTEILRENAPDDATWNSEATSSNRDANAAIFEDFDVSAHVDLFVDGQNVLAIHGMNTSVGGNDSLFYPIIRGGSEVIPLTELSLEFNEVTPAGAADSFVEVLNTGDTNIDLGALKVVVEDQDYAFADATLAPGAITTVSIATAQDGDFIGVYTADGSALVDARRVTNRLRGRIADNGRWAYPDVATKGGENSFAINSDIVINEIMYNPPPILSTPDTQPTYDSTTIVGFDQVWKYNESGTDLGVGWQNTNYAVDGTNWQSGPGVIAFEDPDDLPVPIGTALTNPPDNNPRFQGYYFQTEFELTQNAIDTADVVQVRHLVDDGAVLYLNGTEIHRFNMPSGEITGVTDTVSSVRNAELSEMIAVDPSLLVAGTNVLSASMHNSSLTSNDVVFGLELSTGKQVTPFIPGTPYEESTEEWIELFNKGDAEVDLTGWKISDGVRYDFPEGTKLGAGEYLVVAQDADRIRAKYPGITVLGDFSGSLGNRDDNIVLISADKNIADEVHYYDGGNQWEELGDGGGVSLELINPNADNSKGGLWAASQEADKSEWVEHTFRATSQLDVYNARAVYNEFVFGLLDVGEFLIDDIEVTQNPGTAEARTLIQNGTFEADTIGDAPDKWRLIGNHSGIVIADPTDAGNKVLHVTATGAQGHVHDHAETTFINNEDIVDGDEYEFKFRAKWVKGNRQLNSRMFFSRLSNTLHLDAPEQIGTPGAQNSNFAENVGPVYGNLTQSTATPVENAPVTISIDVADGDGVQSANLLWRKDGEAWNTIAMTDQGGTYSAEIPGNAAGDIIQFYVEATDNAGLKSSFPAAGEDSAALFQVSDGETPRSNVDMYRLIIKDTDRRALFLGTNKMSNWYLPATLVHNDVIYHDVEVRLTGSRWIRPNSGYKIRFNPEAPLYGVHDSVRLDLNGMAEIVMKQMLNRAGTKASAYDDIAFIVSPNRSHSHEVLVNLARYENIYLDEQFGDSSGTKFELDDVTIPSGGRLEGLKSDTQVNQNADIGVNAAFVRSQGANPEFYRAHVLIKSNRPKDDFQSIVRMAQAIHLDDEMELFEATNEVMDVDEWMRHYANQAYFGNWDTYGFRRPKNLRMYVNPADDKVVPLFWDCDLCNFTEPLYNRSENLSRLDEIRDIPHNFRLFWGHMHDFVTSSFNEEYVGRWAAHYGAKAAGQTHGGDENFTGIVGSTATRSRNALQEIERRVPKVDFAITSNDGNDFSVDTNSVRLNGTGWVDIRQLRLQGSDAPLDVFWPESDTWQVDLPLGNDANEFVIEAYDFDGNLMEAKSITVTTTMNNPAIDNLRVTEVNYNPGDPTAAEAGVGHDNSDDFEYIELRNTGNETISLAGIQLAQVQIDNNTEGVAFDFSSGAVSELAPGAFVLVVEDAAAFSTRYGEGLPVAGQWSGGLSNNSETITVQAEGAVIQQFAYNDNWHASTDGGGFSLEIRDEAGDLAAWGIKEGWIASGLPNGSPGTESVLPGDSNRDGVFDSSDLTLVFQANEYEDDIAGNSTFAEGDWNGDGDFTTRDFVYVFRFAAYSNGNAAKPIVESPASTSESARRPVELDFAAVEADRTIRTIDGAFADLDDDDDDSEFAFLA